jgi:hypothetical protein
MSLRIAVATAGLCLATAAQAAYTGLLVESHTATSISGKVVWVCTYDVLGQRVQVVQEKVCETTKQFE